jgi:hypothetical protein
MSSQSPSTVLYSSDGYELAVIDATPRPEGTRSLLVSGLTSAAAPTFIDGNTDVLSLDTFGNLRVTMLGSNFTAMNGTPAPSFSALTGGVITLSPIDYTSNAGDIEPLSLDGYGNLRVAVSGGSVSTTGQPAPTMASLDGALVSLLAPDYSANNGDLEPLSMDTSGNLRVTMLGSNFTGTNGMPAPSSSSSTGGVISLTPPDYTGNNGDLEPISLDGYGNLRVSISGGAVGTTGTAAPTLATLDGALVSLTAPDYTADDGDLEALSMDGYGNLRVTVNNPSGSPLFVTTNKATNSTVTSVAITANSNNVLLAANSSRIAATIYNATNKIAYIKYGSTASATNYTLQLMPNAYFEVQNDWTGEIDSFASNGTNGNILVTEMY